jgi:hypothetical protein
MWLCIIYFYVGMVNMLNCIWKRCWVGVLTTGLGGRFKEHQKVWGLLYLYHQERKRFVLPNHFMHLFNSSFMTVISWL